MERVCAIRTCKLISEFTVELKPKSSLVERPGFESRFVLQQRVRGFPHVFDPFSLYNYTDATMMLNALQNALCHPKRYLKVHSWKREAPDPLEFVHEILTTQQGRDILTRLESLQKFGTDEIAKKVSVLYSLMNQPDTPVSFSFVDHRSVSCAEKMGEEFQYLLSHADGIDSEWIRRANICVDLFLAGRMAMDVSLMFNFGRPGERILPCDHLKPITFRDGWTCTIGVVDTELKHRWKIPDYANQLDSLISKLE
jgi:hypothetical protein